MSVPPVDVVALGGLGEFGMHMLSISCAETTIGIDAGVLFPDPELLGVDLVIPDVAYLQDPPRRLKALFLTHGHLDHIGAVPFILRYVDGLVYGTPLTLAMLEPKLSEHGVDARDRLVPVRPRQVVEVGPYRVEFLRVTHSMPDCVALAIHTPQGVIIHTGDFKIDQTPIDGEHFDIHRFAQLGSEGVLALLSDSTNVDRAGFAGSEVDVVDAFEEIFTATEGKIVVTLFSSSLYRMQVILDLAAQFGRKVAFVGRSLVESSDIGIRLGHLKMPADLAIRDTDIKNHAARDIVCLTTGSQGEPLAALSRIAINDNRHVQLAEGDTVVFSARAIPGNERAIGRLMNHIARRGAEVIYEGLKHVHVSGHGSAEELKLMLSLVRPRYFVPVHGEYRQLARHARVATQVTGHQSTVVLADNGDVVRFDGDRAAIADKVPVGRVLIDGTLTGEVGDQVLRDRRHLAGDGLVVPVLAINRQTGMLEGVPEVITRGVVLDEVTDALVRGASGVVQEVVAKASIEERTDIGLIREQVRTELQRRFRRGSGRRPLVVPVVMEI